jgi:hypothetical protein
MELLMVLQSLWRHYIGKMSSSAKETHSDTVKLDMKSMNKEIQIENNM